jgi:hypothetical protein
MANEPAAERTQRHGGTPLKVAIAVSVFGALGILIVDLGLGRQSMREEPTSRPRYTSTDEAAQAAGATITPTEPRLRVEPEPAVPKPVHPVNPPPQ